MHFHRGEQLFRLWITRYADWRPSHWHDAPPLATALELVEDTAYSAHEAALFLEGFNTAMLETERPLWAVAVPVVVQFAGDVRPGAAVQGYCFADAPLPDAAH